MAWNAVEHDPEWPFRYVDTDFRFDPQSTEDVLAELDRVRTGPG